MSSSIKTSVKHDIEQYSCRRTSGPIIVDGDLEKVDWIQAPRTSRFVDAVTGAPTLFNTQAAMLWDDTYLYVGVWLTETDVRSTGKERTELVWDENAVEVLIAGPGAIYELALNPEGTALEMFYIWKDSYKRGGRYDIPEFDLAEHGPVVLGGDYGTPHPRGMQWGFFDWHFPGLKKGVQVDGILNNRNSADKGWSVELAFPWHGMKHLADEEGAVLPKVGDEWRIALARRQIIDQNTDPRTATWSWQQQGESNLLVPERFHTMVLT